MRPGSEDLQPESAFTRLALQVFRYQVAANPVYGSFVQSRGIDPSSVTNWRDIPAVPVRAFKEPGLLASDSGRVEATFMTSGTRERSSRGIHQVRDLSLYRDSLLGAASRFLRPELRANEQENHTRIRILSLTPSPTDRPESSLFYMLGAWMSEWDDGGGRFLADPDSLVQLETLRGEIEAADLDGTRVVMVGTAFGFVHIMDGLEGRSLPPLPPGSIVVETGGFKGRSRTVVRRDLYEAISNTFGIPVSRIVSEYGMTELLSQFYEPVLIEGGPDDPDARRLLGPPWVRTAVLDPFTLDRLPSGRPGMLLHLDLANLDSVAAVLTDDLGIAVKDGFRLLGRAKGAEPRGCSLMMDELMAAADARDGP